jgi:hypothetical protein
MINMPIYPKPYKKRALVEAPSFYIVRGRTNDFSRQPGTNGLKGFSNKAISLLAPKPLGKAKIDQLGFPSQGIARGYRRHSGGVCPALQALLESGEKIRDNNYLPQPSDTLIALDGS